MDSDLHPNVLRAVKQTIEKCRGEMMKCEDVRCRHPRWAHFDSGTLCCSFPTFICPCGEFVGNSFGVVYDLARASALRRTL
jgi:hypothetical protein